jgi:hypothetical protein
MALKKEHLARLAALAKIKVEDLETAIKDEKEVDITVDEKIVTFSEDEVGQLKNNEYKSGKEKGVEMAVKEVKDELKLEFTGKTIKGLIEAAQKKAIDDAKISPDKKVAELQEKVTTLQATVTDQEKKLSEKDTEVTSVKINGELSKNVPAGTTLDADEVIGLMKLKGYDFKIEEGKLVAMKDGKVLNDKLSNALPVKDVIIEFVKEKKLGGEGDGKDIHGRGGEGGKPPAKYSTLSEVKKHFTDQGKSLLGEEFSAAVSQAAKDNKEFAMDK